MGYAVKNNIFFNEDELSSKKLFLECNKHRQQYLLYYNNGCRGSKIDTKCYKNFNECMGWYTNEKRCDCGIKWFLDDTDVDYTDLNVINIYDDLPTGDIGKL